MIAVTKLINLLDKPFLKYWANKIGLEGINIRNYESTVKKDGNNRHKDIENYIKNGIPFDGCDIFDESIKDYNIIGSEIEITNGKIIGRIDLALSKHNEIYIVDFKRNKNIYLSSKLQLSKTALDKLLPTKFTSFIEQEVN